MLDLTKIKPPGIIPDGLKINRISDAAPAAKPMLLP
jgi:hypothetical protein